MLRVAIWRAVSSKRQALKISLTDQERLAREWAAQQGAEVVAVLTVPGHSRREADVLDLFEDYATHNITAYSDLRQLWKSHAFDVLHAYDDSRFGRSATLATYVMENTLLSGASIYYHEGGWLKQEGGFRYRIAVGSATAAGDVDKMVERSKMGKLDRAQRGLNNGATPPLSHVLIRDPANGKGLRLEVNETKRRLWDDIADLLLEGVAWEKLGGELMARGHLNKRGRMYSSAHLYKLVLNPIFWGNQGLFHVQKEMRNHNLRGIWCFDEDAPRPPDIDLFYNTHPPVYVGEQAEQVKRELRRRSTIIRGKASPGQTRLFTGLLVCGVCWHTMETVHSTNYYGLRCGSRWKRRGATDCPNTKPISATMVQDYLNARIEKALADEPFSEFLELTIENGAERQIEQLSSEIEQLTTQIRIMMREQSLASDKEQEDYRAEIKMLSTQRSALESRCAELRQTTHEQAYYLDDARQAIEDIRNMGGAADFWQKEMRVINQILFRLMCNRQIVVFNGELKGTRPRQTWERRPKV